MPVCDPAFSWTDIRLERLVALVAALGVVMSLAAGRAEAETLLLTNGGRTDYTIVIRHDASEAERFAAKELAQFLSEAGGASFPVVTDREAPRDREIVVGRTSRLDASAIPTELRPTSREGFTLYRDGDSRLVILGQTDRGTLYGVYDFLEQELGCRFLAHDETYVPRSETLRIELASRRFDPVLEYRNLHQGTVEWSVRNRLNAVWGTVPMEAVIGGARFVGPTFVHTFGQLVPAERYAESHPEYYALWKGKRVPAEKNGKDGGLCLTHPQVASIAIESVRSWIEDYRRKPKGHHDTLLIASVSANDDHHLVCECPRCAAVNEEEQAPSGTLIRFVNQVAEAIERDYPMVRIETLAYGFSERPPQRTRPHRNVIIRFAPISSDFARPFSDLTSERNRPVAENLKNWSPITEAIYIWDYRTNFHGYFKPFPDLHVLDTNMRYLVDHGLRGYYAQTAQTESASFSKLRRYVLAKLCWRPETDARSTMEEFCRLYYGEAAGAKVLQYVDRVHAYFKDQGIPLRWRDASSPDGAVYRYDFLREADALLAEAEEAAETPQQKLRVAEERLSVWYLLLRQALAGETDSESHRALPITWHFQTDPENRGVIDGWQDHSSFDDWAPIRVDDAWTNQGFEYHGAAWYALPIEISEEEAGRYDGIHFGAIDADSHEFFLNGQKIDERETDATLTWNEPYQVSLPAALPAGRHVLVARVVKSKKAAGIWRPVSLVDRGQGLPEPVREAARRFTEVSQTLDVSHLSEFYGRRGEQLEHFRGRIKALMLQGARIAPPTDPNIVAHQPAALMENEHRAYTVVEDETALTGACVAQDAATKRTINQSIRWNAFGEAAAEPAQAGRPLVLRVRVRADRLDPAGGGFRFGIARRGGKAEGWRATPVQMEKVAAADAGDGAWAWYEMPVPRDITWSDGSYYAFVWPEVNQAQAARILVDCFELSYVR